MLFFHLATGKVKRVVGFQVRIEGDQHHPVIFFFDNIDIRYRKNRCIGICVDGHDKAGILHARKVLNRAGYTAVHIEFRRYGVAGHTELLRDRLEGALASDDLARFIKAVTCDASIDDNETLAVFLAGFVEAENTEVAAAGLAGLGQLYQKVDDDARVGSRDAHLVFGFQGEVDYGAYALDRQELFDRQVSGRGHFWEYRLGLYTGVRILNRALFKVGGEYVDGALSFDLAGRSRAPEEWTLRGRAWDVAAFAELSVFQLAGLGLDLRASTAGGGTVSLSTGVAF